MRKICLVAALLGIVFTSHAQYFGRNKPRYQNFAFKVEETPHFDIHYYSQNKQTVEWFGQQSEQWYDFHSSTLEHEIPFKNPMILYNNHAEFQQTNAISGAIGVGTGGVTEGFKNRVIMPLTFSNQQTYQVLGHELVHAFQFNMVIGGDSTSIRNLSNLPLWVVEGMAEYMSIGRMDPFTAMWMRNAILNDDVPSLEKMANPRYFPYRYGQAAWSFLTGYYGDGVLKPFFMNTAKYGMEYASQIVFGIPLSTLSELWESSLTTYFEQYLGDKKESRIGRTLLSSENSGRINVSPAISPDGRWVVFMSEKDLFSTDIFLADARNGNIVRKLSSLVKDADLDNYNFLESAGAWSPDSKKFVFVGFSKGQNVLVIKEASSGQTLETIEVPKLSSFTNPTWSPDGKDIVVAGSVEGVTDLFAINVKSGRARQLTNDRYSEIQPSFSSDGSMLVFGYDKRSVDNGRTNGRWTYDLAVMDFASGNIEILNVFHTADNINPTFDHEDNIYFVSDRDGFRNLYRYITDSGEIFQMTDFLTGLSGISRYSPAITAARSRDRVLFTHYYGNEYIIKQGTTERLLNTPVAPDDVDFSAATLPVIGLGREDIVNAHLNNLDSYSLINPSRFRSKRYLPKFQLDYVGGGAGVGVSNGTFGTYTGLQGGVDLLFSDMLGNHQLFTQLALNGTVYDFGGQATYLNRSRRLAWGGGLAHIPTVTGFRSFAFNVPLELDDGTTVLTAVDELNILRIFDQTASVFVHFPFSTTLRLEGGANIGHRSFRWDITSNYYTNDGLFFLGQDRQKVEDIGDEIVFNQYYTLTKGMAAGFNAALVGDNSYFGLTGPLYGYRFRISAEQSYGYNEYFGILADFRKYIWKKPVSFAFRALAYSRWNKDVNSIYPLYIGQMGFVRGYDFLFSNNPDNVVGDIAFDQLLGSKAGLASFEIRAPFTGPKQLALIGSNVLFTDLSLFFDVGLAFDEFSEISDRDLTAIAMSAGVSVRINLFGAMILEPYWAYPLPNGKVPENNRIVFGLNFIPGW